MNKVRIFFITIFMVFSLSACNTNPNVEQGSNKRSEQAKYDTKALYQKGMSAYKKGNNFEAYNLLLDAAEHGHPQAQLELGSMYSKGKSVQQDSKKAAKWYGLSAEQGMAQAQYNLGVMYLTGLGIGPIYDTNKEFLRWRMAGFESSSNKVNKLFVLQGIPKDISKARYWFRMAAEQGHARAQYRFDNIQ